MSSPSGHGRLPGKRCFVTGGASGLGEAISRRFVAKGASVVIADIDVAAGFALADELGAYARFAGRPEDIAAIAVPLAGEGAGFATGAEFRIDGGSAR